MKKIKVENAVGKVLAHDITRIIPGKFKGVGFKKGHVVQPEDIPELRKLGKNSIYVMNFLASHLHEDEASLRIARAVSGPGLRWTDPSEGKSSIISTGPGLLKVNAPGLLKINRMRDIIIATLKTDYPCEADQIVAATRIIPLTIHSSKIERLEAVAAQKNPILTLLPYRKLKVGAIVTGTEVYKGLVADGFDQYVGRVVTQKGSEVVKKMVVPDDAGAIAGALQELLASGCELILTTGGLSVDPDDVTRKGVRRAGAEIVFYGTPILPGAMFLYALAGEVPILGLPACVFYHPTTIFNLVLPRVLAGERLAPREIAAMGHGGLCLNCDTCRYPACPFGK